jgi:hypothetical protein
VHSSTPKAGLLAAVAGRWLGVPIRMHTFTGQPWIELRGLRRRIPRAGDRVIGRACTHCYADSASQRDFLIRERLVPADKIAVLGAGSISGVDLERFSLAIWGGSVAAATRRELEIPERAPIVIFVGRVTKDKGIAELIEAFEILAATDADVHLVLVGPFEPERDRLASGHDRSIDAPCAGPAGGIQPDAGEIPRGCGHLLPAELSRRVRQCGGGGGGDAAARRGDPRHGPHRRGRGRQHGLVVPAKDPQALAAALRRLDQGP